MKKTTMRVALGVWCAWLAWGCNDDPSTIWESPGGAAARPVPLENGLFFAQSGDLDDARVLTVDLAAREPRSLRHELPSPLAMSLSRPGAGEREVVVLTSGRGVSDAAGKRAEALPSHLLIFDRERERLRQPLSGRYKQLALSDDGRFAVASQPTGGVVLQNAIEVVDLIAAAGQAGQTSVVNLTLDGRAPSGLVFAPTGFARRLLVLLYPDAIQLVDLERPALGATSVPLKTVADTRTLEPKEVLFSGDQLFVRTSDSNQLLSLTLLSTNDARGFQPSPALLTAGASISDIALVGSGTDLRVLALAAQLEVFDPSHGSSTRIEARSFSAMLPFEGRSPVDSNVLPRALLYGSGQAQVGFLDLGSDSAWATRVVEVVELGAPLSGIVPLASRKLALGLHSSGNRVSLIDLEQRTVAPLSLSASLVATLLDETASRARLWLLTAAGVLAMVDMETRAASEVPITFTDVYGGPREEVDESSLAGLTGRLLLIPGPDRRRIAVLHNSDTGHLTLVDAEQPTRESAIELVGFFLDGLLD